MTEKPTSGEALRAGEAQFTENEIKDVLTSLYQDGHVDLPPLVEKSIDSIRERYQNRYGTVDKHDVGYLLLALDTLRASLASRSLETETPAITGETSDGYHTFNELYAYRMAYNAVLFNEWASRGLYDVHKSFRHATDEYCFGGGWFVVSAQTPAGQITNHYKSSEWDLFRVPERQRAEEWDGHTPAIALERLLKLSASDAPERDTLGPEQVQLLAWAVSNCHTLARRRLNVLGRLQPPLTALLQLELESWEHVQRICEKAGASSKGVLRAALPTEVTYGSEAVSPSPPAATPTCQTCQGLGGRMPPTFRPGFHKSGYLWVEPCPDCQPPAATPEQK